jgi:hypothetical protein
LTSSDSVNSSSSSSAPRNSIRRGAQASGRGAFRNGSGRGRGSSSRNSRAAPSTARRSPVDRSEAISRLHAFLGVSEAFAQVALELSNGCSDEAASLILSHREILESLGDSGSQAPGAPVPRGLAEALVVANPHLVGAEAQLRRQLSQLSRSSRLGMPTYASTWEELDQSSKVEVFRAVLTDVGGRQQAANRR